MGFGNLEEQQLVFLPELIAHTFLLLLFLFSSSQCLFIRVAFSDGFGWDSKPRLIRHATKHLPQRDRLKRKKPKIYSGLCLGSRQWDWTENCLLDPLSHSILRIPSKEISDPSVSPPSTNTADSAADIKIPRLSGQLSGIQPGAFYKCTSDLEEVDHQQSDTTTSVIVIMPGHRLIFLLPKRRNF